MSKPTYLPNPFHVALGTANAPFAITNRSARRFRPDTIPFAAVPQPDAASLGDLAPLLTPGEEIWITAETGQAVEATPGLEVVQTLPGLQMRFTAGPRTGTGDGDVVQLGGADAEAMLDLKARAFPGFFGPRAFELGTFFGVREPGSERLIAMAGERLSTFTDREVSAVCTDPEHTGQGHGARVIRAVLRHANRLGSGSILHVTAVNTRAIALYEHLGFRHAGAINFVKLRRD